MGEISEEEAQAERRVSNDKEELQTAIMAQFNQFSLQKSEKDSSDDSEEEFKSAALDCSNINQVAKKFGLVSNHDTLEGYRKLTEKQQLDLLKYSSILATDQGGCRLLQRLIGDKNAQVIAAVYQAIIPRVFELMNDAFGNYLI